MSRTSRLLSFAALTATLSLAADKQILLIAGPPSHGPLAHEQNAAALLFQKALNGLKGVHAEVSLNGWPKNPGAIQKADSIFVFCDGSARHLIFQDDHAESISKAAARGAGFVFYHYGVEPPADKGHQEFLDWIGGYFELNYSVNPFWEPEFTSFPKHPIANGVKPFKIKDEWYYNIRFREGMKGVTPILTAVPPAATLDKPDGPRSGNPDVRKKIGQPQVMMWATERADGGRGVGFTGGHDHLNLANDSFRKLILNALVWSAKAKVPPNGVPSTATRDDLMRNLDPKPKK
ncbi:MAG: ThuA domain-containing protein [Bryobacterales bacterium]|nr:ThuA domain-containing protein [Bryobacterales bacterium]